MRLLGVTETRYFEEFYQAIRTSEGESVALFRDDGTVLAHHPRIEPTTPDEIEMPYGPLVRSKPATLAGIKVPA